ncbi:MAG: SHOCT domain-containing protein [Dehalococcoidia bacterium]|nr:SHOCT domain-containing protein [Dehalococcoidia bacterium]
MMWGTSGVGWGWMTLGWVWMVVVWGSVIWLIVWGVSRATGNHGRSGGATPLDIAKERYARGEITKEAFEALKRDLQ